MSLDRKHILHHFILFGIIILAIGVMAIVQGNRSMQFATVLGFSVVYCLYGLTHHALEHDLTIRIVIEYVLVAFLVISAFFFVKGGM